MSTSMKPDLYLQKSTDQASKEDIWWYQLAIESLMYAMTQMRSDIVYAVFSLSQFAHNSNELH